MTSALSSPSPSKYRQYDRDQGQAGIEAPSEIVGYASFTPSAQVLYLVRFVPSRVMRLASISIAVGTAAGADDAIHVGIYDAAMARLINSGAVTGKMNGTGRKTAAFGSTLTVLPATVYYAAYLCPTVTGAPAIAGANFVNGQFALLPGATVPKARLATMASQTILPSTATAAYAVASACPRLFLDEG